eukprot:TRINITY_DN18820_c1_g1_i1.p1 TRINITY_DN18820_c1_g1~~TRINITY_DN18820_c1_g1_i1.p1  ORF type:complete len:675 (+),score=153.61 TRINITY_DN18820_c1_g1_i1:64-2088(+)
MTATLLTDAPSSGFGTDSDDEESRGWPGWTARDERQGISEKMHRMITEVSASGRLGLSQFRTLYMNVFPQRTMDERAWQETKRVYKEILGLPPVTDHVSLEKLMLWLDAERIEREQLARTRPQTRRQWVWAFIGSDDIDFDRDKEALYIRLGVPLVKVLSQIVIILSVFIVVIESLPSLQQRKENSTDWKGSGTSTTFQIEVCCIVFFTIEFFLYTWSYPYSVKRYITTADTWINMGSIAPFYLSLFGVGGGETGSATGIRVVRLMRVLRVLRSLKLTSGRFRSRRKGQFPALTAGLQRAKSPLYMLIIIVVIGDVFLASVMYMAEHEDTSFDFSIDKWVRNNDSDLPDAGQPIQFQSIPDAMWWSGWVLVGTGPDRSADDGKDQYPVTLAGKGLASLAMICSLLVLSYAVAILHGAFTSLGEDNDRVEWRDSIRQEWVEVLCDPRNLIFSGGSPESLGRSVKTGQPVQIGAALRRCLSELLSEQGLPGDTAPLEAALIAAAEALKASSVRSSDAPKTLALPEPESPVAKSTNEAPRWAIDGRFDPEVKSKLDASVVLPSALSTRPAAEGVSSTTRRLGSVNAGSGRGERQDGRRSGRARGPAGSVRLSIPRQSTGSPDAGGAGWNGPVPSVWSGGAGAVLQELQESYRPPALPAEAQGRSILRQPSEPGGGWP